MEKNENGYPRQSTKMQSGSSNQNNNTHGNCSGGGSVGGVTNGATGNDGCGPMTGNTCVDCLDSKPLAYAYLPIQRWQMLYPMEKGLMRGTIFEELDKPTEVYGNEW